MLGADDIRELKSLAAWKRSHGQDTRHNSYQRKPPRVVTLPRVGRLIKAPSGGIPGRVGTLLGSATCDVWERGVETSTIADSTEDITVYNWSTSSACATGDRYGFAVWSEFDRTWYIVAEDCNDDGSAIIAGSITTTPTEPVDAINTEVGSGSIVLVAGSVTFTSSGYGIS